MLNQGQIKSAVQIINEGIATSNLDIAPISENDLHASGDANTKYNTKDLVGTGIHPFSEIFSIIYGDNVTDIQKIKIYEKLKSSIHYNIPLKNKTGDIFHHNPTMY